MKNKDFKKLYSEAEEVVSFASQIEKQYNEQYVVKTEAIGDMLRGAVAGLKAFTPSSIAAGYKKMYNSKIFSETYGRLDKILVGRDKQKKAIQNFIQKLSTGSISDFIDNPTELKIALDELRTNSGLKQFWEILKQTLAPNFISSLEKISQMKPEGDTKEGDKAVNADEKKEKTDGTIFQALRIKPFIDPKTGKPANVSKLEPSVFQSVARIKKELDTSITRKISDIQARNVFQGVINSMLVQMFANYNQQSNKSDVDLTKIKRAVNLALKRTQPTN